MDNITYSLIITLKSGDILTYTDEKHSFYIHDDYKSEILLTPQLFGIDSTEKDYFSLLVIEDTQKACSESYLAFKNYGDKIIQNLNNQNFITNVMLKDEYGNVYYNISDKYLVGIEAGGSNARKHNSNLLVYRLQFYYNKKGE